MNYSKCFLLLLITNSLIFSGAFPKQMAENEYRLGGIVTEWDFLSLPVDNSIDSLIVEPDAMNKIHSNRNLYNVYLRKRIYNPIIQRVSLSSSNKNPYDTTKAVYYASTLINSFENTTVRCYWGSSVPIQIFLNGKKINHKQNSNSSHQLSNHLDLPLQEGYNSIFIRNLTPQRQFTFSLALYDQLEILRPYTETLHSFKIKPLQKDHFITFTPEYPIPLTDSLFPLEVSYYSLDNKLLHTEKRTPQKEWRLPDVISSSQLTKVKLSLPITRKKILYDSLFILTTTINQFFEKYDSIINNLNMNTKVLRNESLQKLFLTHFLKYYNFIKTNHQTQSPRQLGSNLFLIANFLKQMNSKKTNHLLIPVRITANSPLPSNYHINNWLSYKYSDLFSKPNIESSRTYNGIIYVPKRSFKRKKTALLCILPGIDNHGESLESIIYKSPIPFYTEDNSPPLTIVFQNNEYSQWKQAPIVETLNDVMSTNGIDLKRVHIGGVDIGAFAAFDIVCNYPKKFASIVSINGGADSKELKKLDKTSIKLYHNSKSPITTSSSKDLFKTLRQINYNSEYDYSTLTGSLDNIYTDVFNENYVQWIDKQKR